MYDLFIIGGGINGCGIARDAAGRGLSVGLAEMHDIGGATSSASTKLFHGGLRYLEYLEINLVRHALKERETLLCAMPHISWPMRFVLPLHDKMRFDNSTPVARILRILFPWMKNRRPAWLLRLGLFFYDQLAGRKILPATKPVDLVGTTEGVPLKANFSRAYEYSDCWVDDSRLVVLNARDAKIRGARIFVRTKVIAAVRHDSHWEITLEDSLRSKRFKVLAKMITNAAGPWVDDIIHCKLRLNSSAKLRLVRGSHIVVNALYDHEKCYLFQGDDGRVIFTIPYEQDFTLIGTTDLEHDGLETEPECSCEEKFYLIEFVNQYFKKQITADDIVWTFSGVRPLFDDGSLSASATTRDYVLSLDKNGGAPVLNIFGGKLTTYRRLAENAMQMVSEELAHSARNWTAGAVLPGGGFSVGGVDDLQSRLMKRFTFLSDSWASRLIRAYGTDAEVLLGTAATTDDLGINFGATLTEAEVLWMIKNEFARTADDVVWRRSKLGLRMKRDEIQRLEEWLAKPRDAQAAWTAD